MVDRPEPLVAAYQVRFDDRPGEVGALIGRNAGFDALERERVVVVRPAALGPFSVNFLCGEAIDSSTTGHDVEVHDTDVLAVRFVRYGDDGLAYERI